MLDTSTRYHRKSRLPRGRRRLVVSGATPIRLLAGLALIAVAGAAAVAVSALALGLPDVAAGLAARAACSAVHLAHRDPAAVNREDLLPAHPLLHWVDIRHEADSVTARLLRGWPRTARFLPPFGCVLEPTPALVASAAALSASPARAAASAPAEDVAENAHLGAPVQAALGIAVDAAFAPGAAGTDPNTRAVVVKVDGRLVAERYGPGFAVGTPQLGWSMAKTATALLVHQRLADQGRDAATTRALDWTLPSRRPDWLAAWATDERADLTVIDLLTMRDRLDHVEGYAPWSAVPKMLWVEADVGRFAGTARRSDEVPPFRYASAVSNLIQALLRASFEDDAAYWRFADERLFSPLGAPRARFETDATGTVIGSSFLWATPREWAVLTDLIRTDGRLPDGRQLIAPGWLALALAPRSGSQAGAGSYGPHIWRIGVPGTLPCPSGDSLPADALALLGHWGQLAVILPSRRAVVVRMGWAAADGAFDRCAFIAAIDRALAAPDG